MNNVIKIDEIQECDHDKNKIWLHIIEDTCHCGEKILIHHTNPYCKVGGALSPFEPNPSETPCNVENCMEYYCPEGHRQLWTIMAKETARKIFNINC
jgi:hypothetical protein